MWGKERKRRLGHPRFSGLRPQPKAGDGVTGIALLSAGRTWSGEARLCAYIAELFNGDLTGLGWPGPQMELGND